VILVRSAPNTAAQASPAFKGLGTEMVLGDQLNDSYAGVVFLIY